MAFDGYLELGGVELLNAERTDSYVRNLAPGLSFKVDDNVDVIHDALGHDEYRSPVLDGAPWLDPRDAATADFYGLYPLEITGLGSSSAGAATSERAGQGGSVGAGRRGSQAIRVRGLLVAATQDSVEAGMGWLTSVLEGSVMGGVGQTLRYFNAAPRLSQRRPLDDTAQGPFTKRFSTLRPGKSASFRFPNEVPLDMPGQVRWTYQATEGTRFRWGARALYGTKVLDEFDVIAPYRRNHAINSTFRSDVSGWEPLAGSGVDWSSSGGSDGLSYARVTAPSTMAPGSFGAGTYGGGSFGAGDGVVTLIPATARGPVMRPQASTATFSIGMRGYIYEQQVTIALRDAVTGALVASSQFELHAGWERFAVTATGFSTANGLQATLTSSGGDFDIDAVLCEVGAAALDYFDGAFDADGYAHTFEGERDASPSVRSWLGETGFSRDDSDFRPFITVLAGELRSLTLSWWKRPVADRDELLQGVERFAHSVRAVQAPQILKEIDASNGWYKEIDFQLVVEVPGSHTRPVAVDLGELEAGSFNENAADVEPDTTWLADPRNLVPSAPPRPPTIVDDSLETVVDWTRLYAVVPDRLVPLWGVAVPRITVTSRSLPVSQLRVRFHPNPFDFPMKAVDPLVYVGEFIVAYLPSNTTLVLDGAAETATATAPGKSPASANHLLYGTGGGPMQWPTLSGGIAYVVTIDVPAGTPLGDVAVELELSQRY